MFDSQKHREAIARRPDGCAILTWVGYSTSLDILPRIGLDWRDLGKIVSETKKPVADLGASFSTFSAEGHMRGIKIVPLDIMHEARLDMYPHKVGYAADLSNLAYYYTGLRDYPAGADPTALTLTDYDFIARFSVGIGAAMRAGISCDAMDIPVPTRHFSCVIANDSLPKHAADLSLFLHHQLPEILRVTDRTAYLLPFQLSQTIASEPPRIIEKENISQNPEALREITGVAARMGFSLAIQPAKPLYRPPHQGEHIAHDAEVAIFSRVPAESLVHYCFTASGSKK